MRDIIIVYLVPVRGFACRKPFGVFDSSVYLLFTLTKKQNVRYNFRICRLFERRVRKPYRAYKFGTVCKVFTDGRILLVHRAFTCDNRHKPVRLYLVDTFGDKIIVNVEVILVIIGIENGITAERNVRNHKVEGVVLKRCFFKAFNLNFRLRIQFRCDFTRDFVEFNAVKFRTVRYLLRHKTEEVARTHCRL